MKLVIVALVLSIIASVGIFIMWVQISESSKMWQNLYTQLTLLKTKLNSLVLSLNNLNTTVLELKNNLSIPHAYFFFL